MAIILDTILSAILIFLLVFCWIASIFRNAEIGLILGGIVSLAAAYIIYRFCKKVQNKKQTKINSKKSVESLANYLAFNADNAQLFTKLLNYYDFSAEKINDNQLILKKDGKTTFAALCFCSDSATKSDVVNAVVSAKRLQAAKLYLFCNKISADLQALAKQYFDCIFVDADNLYELFVQSSLLPDLPTARVRKTSFAAQFAFNRKRFGWYFASSLFLTVISIISYFPYYTLFWATAMFCLAMYSLLNKKYNPRPAAVTLN